MVDSKVPDLKELHSYQDRAVDAILIAFNGAKEKLGYRQQLSELAQSREFPDHSKVSLKKVEIPISVTSEEFINDTIRKIWHLTDTFKYYTKYLGESRDEVLQYYYFEAVFSQPTAQYPIPQATVSVFFRVEVKFTGSEEERGVPTATFHIEGQQSEYDIRFVTLTADWLLSVLQMKLKFFEKIEKLKIF